MNNKLAICRNCHNHYTEGDKYCRYCGARMGRPKYIEDRFAMIYGPPYHAEHECSKCGHTWTNSGLGSDRQSFCPKCGGEAPAKNNGRWW